MVANNTTDTPKICDLCAHCGTRTGNTSAPCNCTPSTQSDRVPGVPQRAQIQGVPALLHRFANHDFNQEPLSAVEEEERIDDEADDGPWIIDAEASALLDELEEVDFDDVPVCSCGRYCDVQTLDDAWHCSECDPDAEERRKRTQRLLAAANRIRRENGLSESNVTHADPLAVTQSSQLEPKATRDHSGCQWKI
ncbi:hypothetical protein LF1_11410 [Rubripirellula obstinata]|uniref:Uncharacterized protein n=1 Tax=Rubripirellula obstinata TaxID=406547 RepID=A0A5B1CFV7_9BACT|nr:hypothetical protein [Rubripirellula obstinata]KAA1258619.1 hypothetical protein LF1_11410 [Rubripirellula obstinata]